MSALPQRVPQGHPPGLPPGLPERTPETEVIYLLVPPASDAAPARRETKPWTAVERAAFAYWQFRLRANDSPVTKVVRAFGLVAGYVVIGLPILYGVYCAKSFMGIDLFPDRCLGDYVPALEWRGPHL